MYVIKLSIQKLFARPGNAVFSILLMAVGFNIISLLIMGNHFISESARKNLSGIDMVVGAKGSPLQLILSTVLHADFPTGNISLAEATQIASHPVVKEAIPLALGDSYRGFRIAGSTIAHLDLYNAEIADGQIFSKPMEVVVGHWVAQKAGLKTGDEFSGVHGFQETGHAHPEHLYVVKGILKPGAGPLDKLIITPVESVWMVHQQHSHETEHAENPMPDYKKEAGNEHSDTNHDHSHHDHSHTHNHDDQSTFAALQQKIDEGMEITQEEMEIYTANLAHQQAAQSHQDQEITAMLIRFRNPGGITQLGSIVNETTSMQAAMPALELNRLFSLLSVGFDALKILAWIIVMMSGVNIFLHLWNMLKKNLPDIALMRVAGASKSSVFVLLMMQGMVVSLLGWAMSLGISRLLWLMLSGVHDAFQGSLVLAVLPGEWWLLVYALATGFLASLIPAIKAYSTQPHYILASA